MAATTGASLDSESGSPWPALQIAPRREKERILRWCSLLTDIEELKRLKDRLHEEKIALREQVEREFMFEGIVGASPALLTAREHRQSRADRFDEGWEEEARDKRGEQRQRESDAGGGAQLSAELSSC